MKFRWSSLSRPPQLARRLAAVLLVLAVSGCESDDPEPIISESPTASPTATESSPTTSPTSEVETPEAFIRRWVELHTQMQNSGDTQAFRQVSTRCAACIELADLVDRIYGRGGFIRTDGWTIQSLSCRDGAKTAQACRAQILSAPTTYLEQAGGKEKDLPGGRILELFELDRVGPDWAMTHISEQAT